MMGDNRVPAYVKIIPILLLIYLSSPIDLVPDFIPVLGYLDDVVIALLALALIIRLTSGPVVWTCSNGHSWRMPRPSRRKQGSRRPTGANPRRRNGTRLQRG